MADHSTATLGDATLESEADGSNAVFATGEASKITADNLTIHTKGDSSRGLDATYGGTIEATNVDTTEGAHRRRLLLTVGRDDRSGRRNPVSSGKAALASFHRGYYGKDGDGDGYGKPGSGSGGKNSITLRDCDLTGAGENGVMFRLSTRAMPQRARQDSRQQIPESPRLQTGRCSILPTQTRRQSWKIRRWNTAAVFFESLRQQYESWGEEGANGGNFTLNATKQELEGDITCDEISTVALSLADGSSYKGTIDGSHTGKEVSILLDEDSVWEVTGDSYVAAIPSADESLDNLKSNGHTIYYDAYNSANEWLMVRRWN
ncbi:MAG: hypothetical protein ACLVJO_00750 [[Clostridium] scindens]